MSETIIEDWPDYILCNSGSNSLVLHITYQQPLGFTTYSNYFSYEQEIIFTTSTMNYNSSTAFESDCEGQSISDLYNNGQAFNSVGGGLGGEIMSEEQWVPYLTELSTLIIGASLIITFIMGYISGGQR